MTRAEKIAEQIDERRELLERLVWKHVHSLFKCKNKEGANCVMQHDFGGGVCLVPVSSLTEAECLDMIPRNIREAEDLSGPLAEVPVWSRFRELP